MLLLVAAFVLAGCEEDPEAVAPAGSLQSHLEQEVKGAGEQADKDFDQETKQVINSVMKRMNRLEVTCDPETDFAVMMILHHQVAVELAEIELRHGDDAETLALAEQTRAANLAHIAHLEALLASQPAPEPLPKGECKAFVKELRDGMQAMLQCMRSVRDSPDPDADFVNLISCHPEGCPCHSGHSSNPGI